MCCMHGNCNYNWLLQLSFPLLGAFLQLQLQLAFFLQQLCCLFLFPVAVGTADLLVIGSGAGFPYFLVLWNP